MMKNILLSVCVLAAVLSNARALSKEDIEKVEKDMMVHVTKCSEKFGISADDLKAAKESKDHSGIDHCFLACVFKSVEVINEDGNYVPETVIEMVSKYVSNDDDKAKFKNIANDCAKVNEDSVSDGKEGCDRAKMVIGCFHKHKTELEGSRR